MLSALIFLCIPAAAVLGLLDVLAASFLGTRPLSAQEGRWLYGIGAFGVLFAAHYLALVRGGRAERITREFERLPDGGIGTYAAVGYVLLTPLMVGVVARLLSG